MENPPPAPNRQIESMTRLKVARLTIRVWRTEEQSAVIDNRDLLYWQSRWKGNVTDVEFSKEYEGALMTKLAEELEKFPRIAAIEILNLDGNGILIYPDWK